MAALPVQENVASSLQSDLLKIIHNANPEENDLKPTTDEHLSVAPTKMEDEVTQTEVVNEETQPQIQDPPQEQPQPEDPTQEQPQPEDPTQEQPQQSEPEDPLQQSQPLPESPPQEQPQPQDAPQPQTQDTPQEQPQPQDPEIDRSEEPSLPYVSEGDEPSEDSQFEAAQTWLEPQPILVYSEEEDFSVESEEVEEDELNSDMEMETFPDEPNDEYEVLQANEEPPSLDLEGTFVYRTRTIPIPFNNDEPFLSDPEEPHQEPLPYDSDEKAFSFEPNMDSFPFEAEDLLMNPASEDHPYDSGESFDSSPQMDSFPLDNEPLESDYEHLPYGMEGSFKHDDYDYQFRPNYNYWFQPDHDYGFPTEEDQPDQDYGFPSEQNLPDYDYGFPSEEDQLDHDYGFPTEEDQPDHDYGFPSEQNQPDHDYGFPTEEDQPDHDYGFPTEEDQPHWEEDMSSLHEDGLAEESHHEPQEHSMVNLLSFLVSDFINLKSIDIDGSAYVTSSHDDMTDEDSFAKNLGMQLESQVQDQTDKLEEPFSFEVFDDTVHSDDFLQEDEDTEETEEAAGDVSFANFYIPVYDGSASANIPQEYPENGNPEDESEELVPHDEENYSVEDRDFHEEPALKTYDVHEEQDQPDRMMFSDSILFPENPSFEDERSTFLWSDEDSKEDQTEYLGDDIPVTILENPPTYIADVETDVSYPFLLEMLKKETVEDEPWNSAKSYFMDVKSDSDAEDDATIPLERNYLTKILDNDGMNIIVLKDPTENFDNFPLGDEHEEQQVPSTRYTQDQPTRPYWVPQRTQNQQFPKIFFSVTDEFPRGNIPVFYDQDVSFSRPMSYHSLKKPVMRNPFTFLNEVLDDDLPPQYLASPSTSRVMGPDTLSSPRIYHDAFKNPKFSFRDLLHQQNPSFYDDTYANNMSEQNSPPYYPQSLNSMRQYNDLPQQLSYTSPPAPYSAPFDSFQEHDYSPVQNYYSNRRPRSPFYSSSNGPSRLFREDTMPAMYSRQPRREFEDYTNDLPFMSRDFFSSPRPRFPFYPRPQYSTNSPAYKRPPYLHNNFYDVPPYHPIFPRYAPDYY